MKCSAAPAPDHAGHLATFPAGLPEPRAGRMPHRQPRDRHPQMHHRQLAGGPFTRAGHQRTYGGLGRAGVSPDGIPLLLHDSIDATAARSARAGPAPTRYVHRAIPGPVPPGSLRASLSHPPVRASHQPRMPFHQRYPGFRMDARSRRLARPVDVRTSFPVPRRHRPEVLCGGADHDSGRVPKRQGMRHPPAPG